MPDPAPSLEPIAQAVVAAGNGGPDFEQRSSWVQRAAALAAWQAVAPKRGGCARPGVAPGDRFRRSHGGGRSACPGLKRADGSVIAQARVLVGTLPQPAATAEAAPVAAAEPARTAEQQGPPAMFPAAGTETPILPEEAAAAAAAAARVPRRVVDDADASDDLAVEAALSALRPMTGEPVVVSDTRLEEVHPLVDPLPDDAEPNE